MTEHVAKLGKALQFFVIVLSTCILIGLGVIGGVTWYKSDQGEVNTERLHLDSTEGQRQALITEEYKREADFFMETHDVLDDNGNYTAEWLQFLERQRAVSKQRGDETSIFSKIPFL